MTESAELLEERIENAHQAASETQPSWKHRCYAILGALGADYGDPDWEMPDEILKREIAEAERDELRRKVESLEALRPHWAMGYSSDSIAAHAQTAALAQLWKALGAKDQTDAIRKCEIAETRILDLEEICNRTEAEALDHATRVAELEKETAHWKANHKNVVERLRLFTQRPDLPVDRLPAYQRLVELQEQNERLRATLMRHRRGDLANVNAELRAKLSKAASEGEGL